MEFFRRFRKLGNKGFSLVELICGVAILAFVGIMVASVMIVSAKSYSQGSAEAEVQQEAQLVANQISDLLIDSTSDVTFNATTEELKVKKGDVEYVVKRDATTKELTYQEIEYDGVGNATPSAVQVMASGVERFDVSDVTSPDFAKNGYTRLNIQFENDGQAYNANYGITARNKDAGDGTGVAAAIILPTEITLEPFESYDFNPTVVGINNTDVTWTIYDNVDTENTSVNENTGLVTIGQNETASTVRLHCETDAQIGGRPAAECWVNVYIRRVNAVNVTATCLTGSNTHDAGAKYKLTAEVIGTHFPRVPGADYDTVEDYVDPKVVFWTEGDFGAYKVTGNGLEAEVELTSAMAGGSTIGIPVVAEHPNGNNKTGRDYGDAEAVWELVAPNNGPLTMQDGWLRQTNNDQATVDTNWVLDKKQSILMNGGFTHCFQFSFREYPDGTFCDWYDNLYGGDGDNASKINMRPIFTGTFDYKKDYEVRIRMVFKNAAGEIVWPTDDTPVSEYMLSDVMSRVRLFFDSDLMELNDADHNVESQAKDIAMVRDGSVKLLSLQLVQGIDVSGTSVPNQVEYILERKNGSNWNEVTTGFSHGYELNEQGLPILKLTASGTPVEGSYRMKVYIANQQKRTLKDEGGFNELGTENYILWDDTDPESEGIFYFNIVEAH